MKRIIYALAFAACAATAFAAIDIYKSVRGFPVIAPQTAASNTAIEKMLTVSGLQGTGAVYVYDGGANGRAALNVTLYATNAVEGGWTEYASRSFTATNAAVRAVPFAGAYLPKDIKVGLVSSNAATAVSAMILSY